MLNESFSIGGLQVPHRVLMAPLAGVTDLPFRRICNEMGAGLTYIEMLSATAVTLRLRRTVAMLVRHPCEKILGVQVTGPDPETVATAVHQIDKFNVDTVDINMGCPVRKIIARGCGSAILRDPDRVARTITAVKRETGRPVTAKVRLGYDRNNPNVVEVVRRLAGAGADMICIHGRSRVDRYDVPIDYDAIAAAVVAVRAEVGTSIPVVGNGNVMDAKSARLMVERTGCDAVMVGRGVLGNPWIFREVLDPAVLPPTLREWREVLDRHLDYHYAYYSENPHSTAMFRKQLLWYVTGFTGMRRLREALNRINGRQEVDAMITECLRGSDPEQRRDAGGSAPTADQ